MPEHPGFQMLNAMLAGPMEGSKHYIQKKGIYKGAIEWLDKVIPLNSEIMFGKSDPNDKFSALILGDVWNNNILFR